MRDILIVRTHRADAASVSAYDRYAALDCLDVTFCCDERENVVEVGNRNKAVFNNDYLTEIGLFPHPACGWRCGDYFYYVSRIERPDYDFYWMIEPDALINWTDIRRFFNIFSNNNADFLAAKFGRRPRNWGWYGTVKDAYREVYGCYFPLTRISGRAIDHCLAARRVAATGLARSNVKTWPNDEAFVSSELSNNGFICSDFNKCGQIIYSDDSLRHTVPHDAATLFESPPNDLVYHPVRDFGHWLKRLEVNLQTRFLECGPRSAKSKPPRISRTGAAQLRSAADMFLRTMGSRDAALVPLMLSRHAWSERAWSESLPHITKEADGSRARHSARLINRFFGTKEGGEVATAQVGTTKARLGKLRVSSADDFVLGPSQQLGRFPREFALPYAFDFNDRQLLFTLHLSPQYVLEQPFLYAAQRQPTVVIGRVPWSGLDELYGAPNADASPVFIFSIGRTGSTLLETIIRCVTSRTVSEPDTVTQLAVNGRYLQTLSSDLRRQVFWHSVSPFLHSAAGKTLTFPCTIKLRSQANAAVADIANTFPHARYVFMLRKRLPWARSTYRAFRLAPDAAAGRLRKGMTAVDILSKSSVEASIINYEDLISDPHSIVCKLMKIPGALTNEVADQIASTMANDSQGNTTISRDRTSQVIPDEEDWLKAFDQAWQRVRPAAIIDSLEIEID